MGIEQSLIEIQLNYYRIFFYRAEFSQNLTFC